MIKLKRAFQMLAAQNSQREICEQLHMGRGVLNNYKQLADVSGTPYSVLGRMSDDEIKKFISPSHPIVKKDPKKEELEAELPDYISELSHEKHLTVLRLHQEYIEVHPGGYGYTQFKKAVRDYQYAHNLSYHNIYTPGDELQIDFAGDALYLTEGRTGEKTPVVVLCCVLPYSGLGYAKALYNATMEHFFGGISDAFTYMGGTTRRAKSDNMKQWVRKYDRYEPRFNDAAVEWSSYYETSLETCRVRTPRDKGPVESIVNKFYQFVYTAIRHETFDELDRLNERILELVDEFNLRPSKSSGRSRRDIFEAEEKCVLGKLPAAPYRFRYRKEVKLSGTYHISVGKEMHLYSVPFQYVGRILTVAWDTDTVEIYEGTDRIAIHKRSFTRGYTTDESHMPPNHQEYRHSRGYNAAYYQERASEIGPNTRQAVDKILSAPKYVEHAYRSCQGVLSLRRRYSKERIESACGRLSECGGVTYMMIKNILLRNLDGETSEKAVSSIPGNDYVRGAKAFNL